MSKLQHELSKLESSLRRVNNTQQSIEGTSKLMTSFVANANEAVELWDKEFIRNSGKRLELLYVANDVLQNSRRRYGDVFSEPFSKLVGHAMRMFASEGSQGKSKMEKILSLWENRKVLSSTQLERVRADFETQTAPSLLKDVKKNPMVVEKDPTVMTANATTHLSKQERLVIDLMKELDESGVLAEFLSDKVSALALNIGTFQEATKTSSSEAVEKPTTDIGDDEEYNLVETVQDVRLNVQDSLRILKERIQELNQETDKRKRLEEAMATLLEETVGGMGTGDAEIEEVNSTLAKLKEIKDRVESARKNFLESQKPTNNVKSSQSKTPNADAVAEAFLNSLASNSNPESSYQLQGNKPPNLHGNMPSNPAGGVGGPLYPNNHGPPHNLVHSIAPQYQQQSGAMNSTNGEWGQYGSSQQYGNPVHGQATSQYQTNSYQQPFNGQMQQSYYNSYVPQQHHGNAEARKDGEKRAKRTRWGHPDDRALPMPQQQQMNSTQFATQQQLQFLQQRLPQQQPNNNQNSYYHQQ